MQDGNGKPLGLPTGSSGGTSGEVSGDLFGGKVSGGRRHLLVLALYIATVAVLYAPVFFGGKSLVAPLFQPHGTTPDGVYAQQRRTPANTFNVDIGTSAYYEAPVNRLVGQLYLSGQLPLWNPYQASGTPLAAQYSTRVFFPYQILEDISPVSTWDYFMLGRLVIAGFFTYLFLYTARLSVGSSFLGGLFYMLSGCFAWFINLEQFANTAMMLPVLMYAVELMAAGDRSKGGWASVLGRDTVAGAVAVGLMLLAGQPEVALYASAIAFLWFLFRVLRFRQMAELLPSLAKFGLAYTLGLGLAAPLLALFIELVYSSHHIHPAGGAIGTQSLVNLRSLLAYLTPAATLFPTDPDMVVGASQLVEYKSGYFRFLPINGVWDTLGGYTGTVSLMLAGLGTLYALVLRSVRFRGPILFFAAVATVLLLKNIGIPPFLWIGKLPLFDRVWSLRWAGPVLIFSVSMAAAFAFEAIRGIKAGHVTKVTDGHGAKGVRCASTGGANPVTLLIAFGAFFLLSYALLVLLPAFGLVANSEGLFSTGMRPFVVPSILYSTLFGSLVLCSVLLLLGLGTISTKSTVRYSVTAGIIALTALELWWAIPRGWGADSLSLKWLPTAIGLVAVMLFFLRRPKAGGVAVLCFAGLFLYLDSTSTQGLPERQDPFVAAPYVRFLNEAPGDFRVAGTYGALFPNFASALKLQDVHYVNSLAASPYHDFKSEYLYADIYEEGPNSALWFTGRPERSVERKAQSGAGRFFESVYTPVESDIFYRLKGYSMLGVKYFILPSPSGSSSGDTVTAENGLGRFRTSEGAPLFPLVYGAEVQVFENPYALDRAYIVYDVERAGSGKEAQFRVNSEGFNTRERAVIETTAQALPEWVDKREGAEGLEAAVERRVTITSYKANSVELELATGRPGLLVLSDTFYPGWKVKVNGKSAELLRVNGLVRGVMVESGESTVLFKYLPASFKAGLMLCSLSLLVCGFMLVRVHFVGRFNEQK